MAVIVKTHPDLDATSYVSILEFKAWCDQRLKSYVGKTDDQIAAAINNAAEYMDVRFSFVGYRLEKTQLLEWPRQSAWDSRGDKVEGIPLSIKDACSGYAFLALNGIELMPAPVRDESGRIIKSKDEKVGPIGSSVEYADGAGYEMPLFPAVDRLLYRHGLVCRQGGIGLGSVARS